MRDLKSNLSPALTLAPAARTADAAGATVDLTGFESACVVVAFGAWTDGAHTPSIEVSDDGSTWTTPPATDLNGAFVAVSSGAGSGTTQRVGYTGGCRCIRSTMTVTGATVGAECAALVLCGHPLSAPVA